MSIVKASDVTASQNILRSALDAAAHLKNARGLLPDSLKSEGEIVAVLMAGQELGIPPMAAIRGLQVVRGKVIISYDTMVGLLRRAGYKLAWSQCSATSATLTLTAPDGSTHVETWDADRAKRAGLWGKGTWSQYPETMLKARCVSSAARAFAGEVLAGVYVEGEIPTTPAPVVSVVRSEAPQTPPSDVVESDVAEPLPADDIVRLLDAATSVEMAAGVFTEYRSRAKEYSSEDQARIVAAKDAAKGRLAAQSQAGAS